LRPKLIKYDKHPKLHNIPKVAGGLYQCPEEGCSMTKPDKGKIVKHFNCAHNKQTCEYCGKPYSFYAIHEHIAFKHTGETRNVKCPDCDEMFYNNYYVRLHQESVHKQKIFVCPVCGAEFNNRRAEIEHRAEKHTRKRNYPCPYCGKIFRSRTLIQPHCNEAHGGLTVDIKSITSL
jgi:uncharacterized C2H2 Zn-finger protein